MFYRTAGICIPDPRERVSVFVRYEFCKVVKVCGL